MAQRRLGIMMNGVTGRMGMNQHLIRSVVAIRAEGGVTLSDGSKVQLDPILVGRNADKIAGACEGAWHRALDDRSRRRDRQSEGRDLLRCRDDADAPTLLEKAIAAGKHIYCEKPIATNLAGGGGDLPSRRGEGREERRRAGQALPARPAEAEDAARFRLLRPHALGSRRVRLLGVRGRLGQPAQRPSWNYRSEDGGGMILDMVCHWRYVLDNLFGEVRSVSCLGSTHIPERVDEKGKPYKATADDAAYATFELEGGVIAHINMSWAPASTATISSPSRSTARTVRPSPASGLRHAAAPGDAAPGLESRIRSRPSTSTTPGSRCPTTRPTTTASRRSGRCSSATSSRMRPTATRCVEGAKGVQLVECALESWRSAAGSTCRR